MKEGSIIEKYLSKVGKFYSRQYKKLLIVPFTMLFLAVILIISQAITTGDFINRGVSLKGGISLTILTDKEINLNELESTLANEFKENDVSVRSLKRTGQNVGFTVDIDMDLQEKSKFNNLLSLIEGELGIILNEDDYTIEEIGSSLGASFFKETMIAVLIAFLFMGFVVFLYFKTFVPSIAVILAAFSDIVVTLATVNVMGLKISTAGIAAFLMLIGYSVDTDILLSTKVLKRKEGSVDERIFSAMKTGLMMTSTTLAAIIVALIFTQSEVIRQIMTILLIGLLVDMINTWIQNVGILRIYLKNEHKN